MMAGAVDSGFTGLSSVKPQSSSCCGLILGGLDVAGEIEDDAPRASRPDHTCEVWSVGFPCCLSCCKRSSRCFSTSAALSAIVMFVPLPFDECSENRSLNASDAPLAVFLRGWVAGFDVVDFCACWVATYDGVTDRELEEELAAASRENTSFCGLRCWPEPTGEMAPRVRGGSAGLVGAVEFQRSANESDMLATVDQLQIVWSIQQSRLMFHRQALYSLEDDLALLPGATVHRHASMEVCM